MDLQLRKFDPSKIDDCRIVVIIGKRGTGKSVLAKDILFHHKHIPAGIVMSGTEEGNGWYSKFVPDSFIYHDFEKDVVENLIDRQKTLCKQGNATNVFLVLDDCMYDPKMLKEKCMRSLFMNGRHFKIFMVITAQYMNDLPPAMRTQIDYVVVCREPIISNRKKLHENFFGMVPFGYFCALLDKTTENYEALVLDNTVHTNNPEDCMFWYKARMGMDFKMGASSFWKYHARHYNSKFDQKGKRLLANNDNIKKTRVNVVKLKKS